MTLFGKKRRLASTPTIDTGAYAAGDLVGSLITFSNAMDHNQNGVITNVALMDLGSEAKNVEVIFFRSNPSNTTFTDQSPLDIADADLLNIAGRIILNSHSAFADNGLSEVDNCNIGIDADSQNLYACLVARDAVTYDSATSLTLIITFAID